LFRGEAEEVEAANDRGREPARRSNEAYYGFGLGDGPQPPDRVLAGGFEDPPGTPPPTP
jgi:hypothetical protein